MLIFTEWSFCIYQMIVMWLIILISCTIFTELYVLDNSRITGMNAWHGGRSLQSAVAFAPYDSVGFSICCPGGLVLWLSFYAAPHLSWVLGNDWPQRISLEGFSTLHFVEFLWRTDINFSVMCDIIQQQRHWILGFALLWKTFITNLILLSSGFLNI